MEYTLYEILWFFLIYACLGWCMEVGYAALNCGKFVNRGFLNGPVCPIYGVGGVVIILFLTPLLRSVWLLFFGSVIVTSLIELITGFLLEKIYHARWWDYTKEPFNIGGYICLKFSLAWGFVGVFLMKFIHPAIYGLVKVFPHILGGILLCIFLLGFITDSVVTLVLVKNLSKRIELMQDIASKIHSVSDKMGQAVYSGAVLTEKIGTDISEKIEVKKLKEKSEKEREALRAKYEKDLESLKKKYAQLMEERDYIQSRIFKAFPTFRSVKFKDEIEKLKEKYINKG